MFLNRYDAGPSDHVIKYVRGRAVQEGRGLSLFYIPQLTRVVSVPVGFMEAPFEFRERSSDFQRVRVAGEVVYKVTNPRRAGSAADFTVNRGGDHGRSAATAILRRRVVAIAREIVRDELSAMPIREAMMCGTKIGRSTRIRMNHSRWLRDIGVNVAAVFIREVRAPPEVVKALETEHLGTITIRAGQTAYDALLVARNAGASRDAIPEDSTSPPEPIECTATCPFRYMCEDFMGDVRGGKAYCTLFREFSM